MINNNNNNKKNIGYVIILKKCMYEIFYIYEMFHHYSMIGKTWIHRSKFLVFIGTQ